MIVCQVANLHSTLFTYAETCISARLAMHIEQSWPCPNNWSIDQHPVFSNIFTDFFNNSITKNKIPSPLAASQFGQATSREQSWTALHKDDPTLTVFPIFIIWVMGIMVVLLVPSPERQWGMGFLSIWVYCKIYSLWLLGRPQQRSSLPVLQMPNWRVLW